MYLWVCFSKLASSEQQNWTNRTLGLTREQRVRILLNVKQIYHRLNRVLLWAKLDERQNCILAFSVEQCKQKKHQQQPTCPLFFYVFGIIWWLFEKGHSWRRIHSYKFMVIIGYTVIAIKTQVYFTFSIFIRCPKSCIERCFSVFIMNRVERPLTGSSYWQIWQKEVNIKANKTANCLI